MLYIYIESIKSIIFPSYFSQSHPYVEQTTLNTYKLNSDSIWLYFNNKTSVCNNPNVVFLSVCVSVSNPCAQMSCAFLCLLNPSGARCVCPEGKILLNRTCTDTNISGTSVRRAFTSQPDLRRDPGSPERSHVKLKRFTWVILTESFYYSWPFSYLEAAR